MRAPFTFESAMRCSLLPQLAVLGLVFCGSLSRAADPTAASFDCPSSVDDARKNLSARGYKTDGGGDAGGFATAFRVSDRDSERRLLGSLAIERARAYRVEPTDKGIRIVARQREIVLAPEVLGRQRNEVRERVVLDDASTRDLLNDMRAEVCEALPTPSGSRDNEILLYLDDRCRAGDERACRLRTPR